MADTRVMVVDDTSLYRTIVNAVLSEIPGVEIVGTAANGKIALAKMAQLKPDLVTLDIEMPEMDGLETLRRMRTEAPEVTAVMISSLTREGAAVTLRALELGAFDFVAKPAGHDLEANKAELKRNLQHIVRAFTTRRTLSALTQRKTSVAAPAAPSVARQKPEARSAPAPAPAAASAEQLHAKHVTPTKPVEIVAIGVSTGGPNALAEVVPKLPGDLRVPVVIVQHMPPTFTAALAQSLDNKSALRVVEGEEGQVVEAGTVYIAPGGKHMKIVKRSSIDKAHLVLTEDPPENHCRPAVDYLFRSVAEVYQDCALGVILTGMGADGALGLKEMKKWDIKAIAQDEETSVVFGMPQEAIKAGVVDTVQPLERIAAEIARMVG